MKCVLFWGTAICVGLFVYKQLAFLRDQPDDLQRGKKRKHNIEMAMLLLTFVIETTCANCYDDCIALVGKVLTDYGYMNKAEITVEADELVLEVGQVYPVSYSIYPASEDYYSLVWQSSNHDVVMVQDGILYAKAVGVAIISISFDSLINRKVKTIHVYVVTAKDDPVVDIQFDYAGLSAGNVKDEWYLIFIVESLEESAICDAVVYIYETAGERLAVATIQQKSETVEVRGYAKLDSAEKIVVQAVLITVGGYTLNSEAKIVTVP